TRNDTSIPTASIRIANGVVTIADMLVPGRNVVGFSGTDGSGDQFFIEHVLWAGDHQLDVILQDETGQALPGEGTVRLGSDPNVRATASSGTESSAGEPVTPPTAPIRFEHIPPQGLILEAYSNGFRRAVLLPQGVDSQVVVTMRRPVPPSHLGNNDFSQGTE